MNNLFVADARRAQFTAIDTAMDTLPRKAKQVTIILDLSPDGLVDNVTTTDTSVKDVPEFLMKTPPVSSTNTTGIRGVSKLANGTYRADITRNGKQTNLGTYDSFQDAVEARLVAQWGLEA